MGDWALQQYLSLARGLNPGRDYVFVDVGKLREQHPGDSAFISAVQDTLREQLGSKATPELLADFTKAARTMETFDGDAKILNTGHGEVAMVYYSVPSSTLRNDFVRMFSGFTKSEQVNPSFASMDEFKRSIVIHEVGHATSPERNAINTSVRYETGHEGLYNNNLSETRAEIVEAMVRMRMTGNASLAQEFNDMRSMRLFLHGGEPAPNSMPGRIYPEMEYHVSLAVQGVIDKAKETGHFNFSDREIAETADRVSRASNQTLREKDLLVRAGRVLGEIQDQLRDVPEAQKLQAAVDRGLLKPDQDITRRFIDAYENITGTPIHVPTAALAPSAGPDTAHRRNISAMKLETPIQMNAADSTSPNATVAGKALGNNRTNHVTRPIAGMDV